MTILNRFRPPPPPPPHHCSLRPSYQLGVVIYHNFFMQTETTRKSLFKIRPWGVRYICLINWGGGGRGGQTRSGIFCPNQSKSGNEDYEILTVSVIYAVSRSQHPLRVDYSSTAKLIMFSAKISNNFHEKWSLRAFMSTYDKGDHRRFQPNIF